MINQDFSVIDIETTGFSPKRGDKIIEIGIIRFDKNGNELKRFETLINPERDVSAFNIHGISAQMVKDAPKFDEVADDIFSLLAESVIVGHNGNKRHCINECRLY